MRTQLFRRKGNWLKFKYYNHISATQKNSNWYCDFGRALSVLFNCSLTFESACKSKRWGEGIVGCNLYPAQEGSSVTWKFEGNQNVHSRTENRNRSPRLITSGIWNRVDEGSRQNRSVTSGKGLALRAGLYNERFWNHFNQWTQFFDEKCDRFFANYNLTSAFSELVLTWGIWLFN